jgi:hypothetical protein
MDAVIESAVGEARETGPRRNRDMDLLRYVGRHGVVRIGQVMAAMGAGRSVTYDRVAVCVDAGLLERLELVRSEPGLLRATREGLRYAGLGLPVAVVSPGAVDHWLRCAATAQLLGEEFGHERILTEREIVLAEQIEERPIASAKVGELPNGAPRMHRADLAVLPEGHSLISSSVPGASSPAGAEAWDSGYPASSRGTTSPSSSRTQGGGRCERTDVRERDPRTEDTEMRSATSFIRPIAVEVELTPKSPRRLEGIIRGWRRAVGSGVVAEVRYHCAPGQTRRAVERAVAKVHAQEVIGIGEVVGR